MTMKRRDFVASTALAAGGLILAPKLARPAGGLMTRYSLAPPVDPATKELLLSAVDAAMSSGAQFVDARVELVRTQSVSTRELQITGVSETSTQGVGVRVFFDGSWGFAATQELSKEPVARAAQSATAMARANAKIGRGNIHLAPVDGYGDVTWTSDFEIDPWDVSVEDKAAQFLALNEIAVAAENVSFVSSGVQSVKIDKTLATSEGTVAAQRLVRLSPFMTITAVSSDRSDFQTRGSVVEPAGSGYEYVNANMTSANVERWAAEASAKLSAASVESGKYDLVLHPSHLWLTIHESIGHPTELDRALGYEANYAGTSFLSPPEAVLGSLRYGPDFMNVEAERTSSGGLVTIGWDDEGVPADRWMLIDKGIFVDYQTTREQVDWISDITGITHSHGCAYADGWSSIPFQRMPNINLMPGEEDLTEDDIVSGVDDGIFVEGRGSYSIDQQRYNFQFGGQVFWEIKGGKKTRMLRDVGYQARTTDFWNSLAAIGGPSTYFVGGTFRDGKGQPGQINAVSHGCPVSLFQNISVLNTGG
ncbi:MAG: TldD/PmbA family protein [Gemmatimonadota bacterium]